MKASRRRRFAIASAGVLTLSLPFLFVQLSGAPPARPAPTIDLSGYWTFQDKHGSATVLMGHIPRTNQIKAIFQRGDNCELHEGHRDYYIKGTFNSQNVTLEGMMCRCTGNAQLHTDCPDLKLWDPPYTAEGDFSVDSAGNTIVTRFRGTYAGEYYNKNPNTGKYICTPTRQDESFILTRVLASPPGGPAPAPPGPLPGEAPPPSGTSPLQKLWDSVFGNANVDEKIWDRKHDGPESPGQ